MINKILIILSLFALHEFKSQIKMDFNIDQPNKKAKVVLLNESKEDIIIPLDTSTLSPYFENICLEISNYIYATPYLGLNIKITNNNQLAESLAGSVMMNDHKESKLIFNKTNLEKKKYEKKLKSWQKTNEIKSFDDAKINYYIFNNLIYLRPGEKIEKEYYFDLHNITNSKYLYHYYRIEKDKKYNISLSLNIDDCIYKYLTKGQKEKFVKYKLFSGSLESNKIQLNGSE